MEEQNKENVNDTNKNLNEEAEYVEKVLAVVIKRRKTIPTKCMELHKQTAAFEFLRLENAKVITQDNKDREQFKRTIQGLKILKSFQFSVDDLREAEKKIKKYHKRTKEINSYLENRKKRMS